MEREKKTTWRSILFRPASQTTPLPSFYLVHYLHFCVHITFRECLNFDFWTVGSNPGRPTVSICCETSKGGRENWTMDDSMENEVVAEVMTWSYQTTHNTARRWNIIKVISGKAILWTMLLCSNNLPGTVRMEMELFWQKAARHPLHYNSLRLGASGVYIHTISFLIVRGWAGR